jgi:spectinomycin phosphotransferase
MLEQPNLQDEKIIACLQDEFSLPVSKFDFLPLGADQNTAVYRAVTENGTSYFVKLRMGNFEETALTLPKFLCEQNIPNIIPPFVTKTDRLWANLETFKIILYPFIEGRNGFDIDMSNRHWFEFGAALKRIHTAEIPSSITNQIRKETYSPQWREMVKASLNFSDNESFIDSVAVELAAFMKTKRSEIFDLLERTERLALKLQTDSPPFTVCHSDLHAGNILINGDDRLYIVDWDNPILAPKERDLMYPGGAQGFTGHTPQEEEILFYEGYGQTQINQSALAYYRYERIIEDIAVYCEQLLSTDEGGEDRKESLGYLKSNFMPNGTIQVAYQADKTGLFT